MDFIWGDEFDDNGRHWDFRCSNHVIALDTQHAPPGHHYVLHANDSPPINAEEIKQPSIRRIYPQPNEIVHWMYGPDPGAGCTFSIYAATQHPIDDRRLTLAIWLVGDRPGPLWGRAVSEPFILGTEWKKFAVDFRYPDYPNGDWNIICEAYWNDHNPISLMFAGPLFESE